LSSSSNACPPGELSRELLLAAALSVAFPAR
jgi:hypothetical protein